MEYIPTGDIPILILAMVALVYLIRRKPARWDPPREKHVINSPGKP